MNQQKSRRITVRGIIFNDGLLLAQQLQPDSNGTERDYWCTPGGGLEPGESLHAGLTREMIEETGIVPKIGKLLFIQQYEDEMKEFIEFFFHIENPSDYKVIDLDATSHGNVEIKRVDFITPAAHQVLPAFLQDCNIQQYITTDSPVYIANHLA